MRDVTRQLGDPLSADITTIPNPHDRVIPNVRAVYTYPGFKATFVIAVCCDRTLLQDVAITDLRDLRKLGIAVPASRQAAVATFGKPARVVDGELTFVLDTELGSDSVSLRYRDGKLSGISWRYFID